MLGGVSVFAATNDPEGNMDAAWRANLLRVLPRIVGIVAVAWLAAVFAATPSLLASGSSLIYLAIVLGVWLAALLPLPNWARLAILEAGFLMTAGTALAVQGLGPGVPVALEMFVLLAVVFYGVAGGVLSGTACLALVGLGAWGWTSGFLPLGHRLPILSLNGRDCWIRLFMAQVLATCGVTGVITYVIREMRRVVGQHRLAEEKFSKAFRACPDALIITELATGRYLEVNEGHERLTGFKREEVVGHTSVELGAFPDAAARDAVILPVRRTGSLRRQELQIKHRSGAKVDVVFSAEVFTLGGEDCVLTLLQDVTDQKRTEAALKHNEESFRSFVENAGVGVYRSTPDGRIVRANPALLRVMGFDSFEEMASRNLEAEGFAQQYPRKDFRAKLEHDGYLRGWVAAWTKKDGTTISVRESASVVRGPDGRIEFYDGIIEDNSERMRAEEALRESEERFRTLTAAAFECVVISEGGRVIDINDQGLALFGYSREEMVGRPIADFVALEDRELVARQIRENSEQIYESRLLRKDGTVFQAETKGRMATIGGRRLRMAAIHDITERRQSALKRQHLEEQLLQMQKMEALGTLAGGIAHDFNNILTGILANLEIAELDLPPEHPAYASVEAANQASRRARELVARILSFSMPKSEHRAPAPLGPVILEAVQLLRVGLPSGIEIRTRIDPKARPIDFDPGQIHQVIMNLGTNSAHALRERGGAIMMELRPVVPGDALRERHPQVRADHAVCFTLRDNGCGMTPEVLKRIFEPFYTTKEFGQGTGLGLAVVHTIMKAHNGAIVVESLPGLGTTFELYFPAAPVAVPEANAGVRSARKGLEPFGHHRFVMFVDDEDTVRSIGTTLLRRLGFEPVAFSHPKAALEAFRAEPAKFAAVISDLTMPQMTGIELGKTIMRLRPDVPVILTTGYLHAEAQQNAREGGIAFVITKPFEVKELVARLREALKEPAQAAT